MSQRNNRHVGLFTGFERADQIFHSEGLCSAESCGFQNFLGGNKTSSISAVSCEKGGEA